MSLWTIVGQQGCHVGNYVTNVVSEEEAADEAAGTDGMHRWVVEACEGQIQQLMKDPMVVRITWERR